MRKDIREIRVYDPIPDDYQEDNYILTAEIRFKTSNLVIKIDSEHTTDRDLTNPKNSVYINDLQDIIAKNIWQDLDTILGLYYDDYRKSHKYIIAISK